MTYNVSTLQTMIPLVPYLLPGKVLFLPFNKCSKQGSEHRNDAPSVTW